MKIIKNSERIEGVAKRPCGLLSLPPPTLYSVISNHRGKWSSMERIIVIVKTKEKSRGNNKESFGPDRLAENNSAGFATEQKLL